MQQNRYLYVYISEMTPTISEQLIDRCCKGEHQAQMELYSLLFRAVYSSALRITCNAHDAEDIAQESFLKAFRNLEKYRDGLPFILRRMAINASIDLLRKRKVSLVEMGPQHDIAQQAEDPVDTQQDIEAIKAAIGQLPTGYRVVITLRLIEDLSFEQIAEELQISSSTARSQFVRAKERIIEIIQKNGHRR